MSSALLNLPFELSDKARTTAARYLGTAADDYESRRRHKKKWQNEDIAVRAALNNLPRGTSILDIPCGTGRFFQFFRKRGFRVLGLDISPEMIAEAKNRAGNEIWAELGNIFDTGISPQSFDVVLCIRFLNLIELKDVKRTLAEMQRIAKDRIIFSLRTYRKHPEQHYHQAHSLEAIAKILIGNWRIKRADQIGRDNTYRMVMLCNG
jgi:ubiquinone/menaquinone biosynthesis C-methylase UbiE